MARRASLTAALCLAALLAGLLPLAAPPPARAATTFTVTTTGDGGDETPDGVCDSNPSRGIVDCTLREAIQEANFVPGEDIIVFDIFEAVGGDVKTIRPTSKLPPINDTVIVDGYSQPGARRNTASVGTNAVLRIELDGSDAGEEASGLIINAPDTEVHGLVVNGFADAGIAVMFDAARVRIAGNFIGTDATGTQYRGNSGAVYLFGADATIGGTFRGHRNLISGNRENGILLSISAVGNRIQGNLIGTDATGKGRLGNGDGTAGAGAGIVVKGNRTEIGGRRAGAANTIAFNGVNGVEVGDEAGLFSPRFNAILGNAIFANDGTGGGIDLLGPVQGGVGVTPNDPGDGDAGSNDLQNFPVLTKATTIGATTTIRGRLSSTPQRDFLIQFFANPPGEDEGQTFLGEMEVRTNGAGNTAFTFRLERRVRPGMTVTATATDLRLGNTSEFSRARTVSPGTVGP